MLERNLPEEEEGRAAVLLRSWNAKRGLTRSEFLAKLRRSCFAAAGQDRDLWENEVSAVAAEAFDELLATVRGENFLKRIGLIQMTIWLRNGGKAKGAVAKPASSKAPAWTGEMVAALAHGDVRVQPREPTRKAHAQQRVESELPTTAPPVVAPPTKAKWRAAVQVLPVKSKRQVREMLERRRERDRMSTAETRIGARRVDWVARASVGIAAAEASKAERDATALEREAEALLCRISPRSKFIVPRLQRWEEAAVHDLAGSLTHRPILLSSTGSSLRSPTLISKVPSYSPRSSRQSLRSHTSRETVATAALGAMRMRERRRVTPQSVSSRFPQSTLPPLDDVIARHLPLGSMPPSAPRPITGNASSSPRVLPLRRKNTSSNSLLLLQMQEPPSGVPANDEEAARSELWHQIRILEEIQRRRDEAKAMTLGKKGVGEEAELANNLLRAQRVQQPRP